MSTAEAQSDIPKQVTEQLEKVGLDEPEVIAQSNNEDVPNQTSDEIAKVQPTIDKKSQQELDREDEAAKSRIVKKDVKLPKCWGGKLAFCLYNVMTEEECKEYIAKTEAMGYEAALVNVGYAQKMMKDVRNNTRYIWDSFEEADRIWRRIKPYIPEVWADRQVMGLNERLRFLRYYPREYFKPHFDGMYERENGERSYITIQLYLNQGFKGGSTTFMDCMYKNRVECVPKTGMILVFQHDIFHEGSELKKGTKYTMRTDIMYSGTRNPVVMKEPVPVTHSK